VGIGRAHDCASWTRLAAGEEWNPAVVSGVFNHMHLVLAFFVAASTPSRVKTADAPPQDVVASLERTGCEGTCPIYKMTIHADGRVEWLGEAGVTGLGLHTGHATPEELKAVRRAFDDAHFFSLRDRYECAIDFPHTILSYRQGGRFKRVERDCGCPSNRDIDALSRLESQVGQILGISQWISHKR
jgi:hypothetical protein